jgi:hypothetical protein
MWKSSRLVYKKFVSSFHQTKEEIGRVSKERDAARDDIAVLQVGTTYLLLSNFFVIEIFAPDFR